MNNEKLNLKTETKNKADENYKKLIELFPNIITETIDEEGNVIKGIDKDKLIQEINCKVIDSNDERYEFTWPGKKKAMLLANTPVDKALRPCKEDSVNFYSTENLYIEGDNLKVLKILQETYLGKIKMIYIDPPYNTDNDFIYKDRFKKSMKEFKEEDGNYDEYGNRLVENKKTNGQFHTDWLNMMYSRLKVARDLLADDGVIFISIDDNEVDNLKKLCNEIFGEDNMDTMIWRKSGVGRDGKMKNTDTIRKDHEYILIVFKNTIKLNKSFEKPNWQNSYNNPDNDPRGNYKAGSISKKEEASDPNNKNFYTVKSPSGKEFTRQFDISKEEFEKLQDDNRIYWGKNGDSVPSQKIFENEKRYVTTSSFYTEVIEKDKEYSTIDDTNSTTTKGSKELDELLEIVDIGKGMRPKPSSLINKLIQIGTNKDDIILDFFSGSGTTAHAVMRLNVEDGGNRKFIMVQLQEEVKDEGNGKEAYKFLKSINKPKNICEIGKKRIKKAGDKILEENKDKEGIENLDIGFRVLKLDSSNMKEVYINPNEISNPILDLLESNIKEDRTDLDLLFQVMLELDILLSSKIEEKQIDNKKVFYIENGYLIACFENNITEEIIEEIAKEKPYYFIMRDSGMKDDNVSTNFEQIFKTYSPETKRRVL